MSTIQDTDLCIQNKFIEIVKNVTHKELQDFDAAVKRDKKPIKCEDSFVAIIEITQSKVDYIRNDLTNKNRDNEQQNY